MNICLSLLTIGALATQPIAPNEVLLRLKDASNAECIQETTKIDSNFCVRAEVSKSKNMYTVVQSRNTLDCGARNCKTYIFLEIAEAAPMQFLFGGKENIYLPPMSEIRLSETSEENFSVVMLTQSDTASVWTGKFCDGIEND